MALASFERRTALPRADIYINIINGAMTRPLDYDYLKALPPGPQRFYELLSYQMYAALKNDLARAKLTYSHLCKYAPQTRYLDWEQARKQMAKVHKPHRDSGYIASIDFQETTDQEGQPDWIMCYTPGPKARAQYRAFTKRGGPVALEIEPLPAPPIETAPEPTQLQLELIKLGVTPATAGDLVREHPEEMIRSKVELLDWMSEKHPQKISDPPAYLAAAIRKNYASQRIPDQGRRAAPPPSS